MRRKCYSRDSLMGWKTVESKCSASKCSEEDDVEFASQFPRTSKIALSSIIGNQRQDQLIDSLTSHISLYHSRSKSFPRSKTISDRSSVLKWFSSLTVHQRQSHLTVVDSRQVQILTRMMSKLRSHGCGGFIILPDILEDNIPSLCYKRFTGLLSRVIEADEAEKILVQSVLMFGSREGESIDETSFLLASLDSITVADNLVEDIDKFVDIMDDISNGCFLKGEGDDLHLDWVELEWLKGRGYYTIGAFIGNMVEVCLRLAWQNKCGGRKRGVKSKEKFVASGVAGNLFWRKKGCSDWWLGLAEDTKRKLISTAIGKGSRSLVNEVFKDYKNKGLIQLMDSKGAEPSFGELKEKILLLQSVIEILSFDWGRNLQMRRLFFSSLGSVFSVQDCILRKLRGLLMFISLDCMKLELFSEVDSSVPIQKSVATDRKKNGKTQTNRKSKLKKKDPNEKFDSNSHQRNDVTLPPPSKASSMEIQLLKAGKEKGTKQKKGKSKNSKASKCASNVQKADMGREEHAKCTSAGNIVSGLELESPRSESPTTALCSLANENVGKVAPCVPDNEPRSSKHDFVRGEEKLVGVKTPNNELHMEEKSPSSQSCHETASPTSCLSFEHPNSTCGYHQLQNSNTIAAADRLHLDVGFNSHVNVRQPLVQTVSVRRPRAESNCTHLLSRTLPMSLDWPPVVRNFSGFAPSWTYNYDSEFIPYRNHRFQKILSNGNNNDDRVEAVNLAEKMKRHDIMDDCDVHWVSEDDIERHAVSGMDYNQYFGGGVMYWDPSDQPASSFSRPPSLSSDDSLWAWHEADVNRTVDDMVTFPSSFSTNGLNSPRSGTFCSPFDPQALSYALPNNDISSDAILEDEKKSLSGKFETRTNDSAYPILRPIIIPSMSKRNHDPRSPCISSRRQQEQPRMKRPPSPVVLCVPRARRPPPPSPVKDARNQRKFPTVRSGSSSPRHWGVRCWYQEGITLDETCVRLDVPEVVLPSWRNKTLSKHAIIPPIAAPLLHDLRFPISHLSRDQEHPDVSLPLQPPCVEAGSTRRASLSLTQSILHDEIDHFCRQVATANAIRKPFINWAVKRVSRSLQVLWPRSRTSVYGSNVTGLSLPTSDVDLVVCLPPVRNLEPIKEAGILEGRNGIKETCLQHAARYLANQEWVKSDSLRTVENTAIPLIMLVVEVPGDLVSHGSNMLQPQEEESCKSFEQDDDDSVSQNICPAGDNVNDVKCIRLDISFKSPTHTGLQTSELVKSLTEKFPAVIPLALVLKQFLADRNLERSYSGGLSSYCVVLLVTRFLQHEHHLGRILDKNLGCFLMEFLYFFGNVFDPREMRISIQGSGIYIKRARDCSIDPLYIDDPLFPMNNVGRNCFRIHQCIKAFAEAYCTLENESLNCDAETRPRYWLLSKIVPSVTLDENLTLNTMD